MKHKKTGKIITIFLIFLLIASIVMLVLMAGIGFNPILLVVSLILFIPSIILLLAIWIVYNKIVNYKNKVAESLASIDIHLKLRFDLIPNLVATIKGYVKHEQEVLEEVMRLRNLAVNTVEEKEKVEVANQLVPKMRQIIAVSENYPKLKADAMFKSLMEELVAIEDKIVAARRFYDSNVNEYNTLISVFPNNFVSNAFGFEKCELLKIDAGENIVPKIDM